MANYTRKQARDWAWVNVRGVANVVNPTFTADLTALNEKAIRYDIRKEIEYGFWGALLVAGAPLAAAVVTGCALWRHASRRSAGVAWAVIGLLACFNVLAILTIGVIVFPVTLALAVACSTHGRKPHSEDTRSGVAS